MNIVVKLDMNAVALMTNLQRVANQTTKEIYARHMGRQSVGNMIQIALIHNVL